MASRGSYPHPILDNSDDVLSECELLNVQIKLGQQDIEIDYEIRTDDPDVRKLLEDQIAFHSLRWRCSSTISTGELRPQVTQVRPNGYRLSAWLDQQLVRGDVDAEARVIAAKEIAGHRWSRQNPVYGDSQFRLLAGDVLADAGAFRFNARKSYDPLDPPVGSCFRFERSSSLRKGIRVQFDNDEAIGVLIAAETFDEFKLLSHRPELQIALVVLPALMETVNFIRSNAEEEPLDDKGWYRVVSDLVTQNGDWEDSAFELAQKILEHPTDIAIRSGFGFEGDD